MENNGVNNQINYEINSSKKSVAPQDIDNIELMDLQHLKYKTQEESDNK